MWSSTNHARQIVVDCPFRSSIHSGVETCDPSNLYTLCDIAKNPLDTCKKKFLKRNDVLHGMLQDGQLDGSGWKEARLPKGPPSYKYKNGELHLQKKKHGRLPGYADRILFRNLLPPRVYKVEENVWKSDHLPVLARFQIHQTRVTVVTHNCAHSHDERFVEYLATLTKKTKGIVIAACQELNESTFAFYENRLAEHGFEAHSSCGSYAAKILRLSEKFTLACFVWTDKGRYNLQATHMPCAYLNRMHTKGIMHLHITWQRIDKTVPSSVARDTGLHVFNLHAPFKDETATEAFLQRFTVITQKDKDSPAIAAGDFNSRSKVAAEASSDAPPQMLKFTKNVPRCEIMISTEKT